MQAEKRQKIYLASPFFTPEEEALVRRVAELLRTRYEVFVPMEHEIGVGEDMPHKEWAKAIFDMDVAAIREADFAVVLDHGAVSDAGTAWEAGFLFGIGKPSYILSAVGGESPLHSLMMTGGCSRFFTSLDALWACLCGEQEGDAAEFRAR